MNQSTRYSPEIRERAVWKVLEHQRVQSWQWTTICLIATKTGCTSATLRNWVRPAPRVQGRHQGVTSDGRDRLNALERENREQRRANHDAGGARHADDRSFQTRLNHARGVLHAVEHAIEEHIESRRPLIGGRGRDRTHCADNACVVEHDIERAGLVHRAVDQRRDVLQQIRIRSIQRRQYHGFSGELFASNRSNVGCATSADSIRRAKLVWLVANVTCAPCSARNSAAPIAS